MSDFRLRKLPGQHNWYVYWSEAGRSRRVTTGTRDRREAEAFLKAFRLETGNFGAGEVGLAAVLNHYYDSHASKLPSAIQANAAIRRLKDGFPLATAADVLPLTIDTYIETRREAVSDETISRELSVLRAALNRAARDKLIPAAPRVHDVPRKEARERVLSRKEAAALLRACRGKRQRHLALFVRLCLYTGARPGAVLDLTWDRVDFERSLIDFALPTRAATNKRRTVVPFSKPLATTLSHAKARARSAWVIDWGAHGNGSVKKSFARACDRAGLEGVTPNVLRHTAATWARMNGADLFAIGELLGHTKLATTKRYAKYGPGYLRGVTDAIRGKPARRLRNNGNAGKSAI
jgi:integrase